MKSDRDLLIEAIIKAEEGIEEGCGPFGAIIVRNGNIIAGASNEVIRSQDPTAHAEVLAIRKASAILGTHDLSDCVLYTSCEPCPMCLGAVYWAGIRKVVYASDRTDAERSGFSDRFIYDEMELEPSARKIEFVKITDAGGNSVFRKWDNFENRIPY